MWHAMMNEEHIVYEKVLYYQYYCSMVLYVVPQYVHCGAWAVFLWCVPAMF